jgi:hypothetical protein
MPCATAVIAISDFLIGEKNGHHGHGQRSFRENLPWSIKSTLRLVTNTMVLMLIPMPNPIKNPYPYCALVVAPLSGKVLMSPQPRSISTEARLRVKKDFFFQGIGAPPIADPRAAPPTMGRSCNPDFSGVAPSTICARKGTLTTASKRTKPVRKVDLNCKLDYVPLKTRETLHESRNHNPVNHKSKREMRDDHF